MTALELLLVEDEDSYVNQYENVLCDYIKEKNRSINMKVCKTMDQANNEMNKRDTIIDAAIVDLNLGKTTADGGNVICVLKNKFRVPVAVLTGTPGDADNQPPVIAVFTKGKHSFGEVLDCLWQAHSIGLTRIMGGRGQLEGWLHTIFLRNLIPTLEEWTAYHEVDSKNTEKALLRYALGHLVAEFGGDEKIPCHPVEFYLDPPLSRMLTTGSLLRRNADDCDHMIMTPACDLVLRNGKPNVESMVLVEIVPENTVYNCLNVNSSRKKKLRKNSDKICYHWLPKSRSIAGGFLDFRKLQTVSLDDYERQFKDLEVRVAPGFIKDIVSRFSAFYARQGQPVICSKVDM